MAWVKKALQESRRQQSQLGSSGSRCARVAVLLYALNGFDAACSVAWLESEARRRGKAQVDRRALQRQVEEWFLQTDAGRDGEVLGQGEARQQSVLGAARAFFA